MFFTLLLGDVLRVHAGSGPAELHAPQTWWKEEELDTAAADKSWSSLLCHRVHKRSLAEKPVVAVVLCNNGSMSARLERESASSADLSDEQQHFAPGLLPALIHSLCFPAFADSDAEEPAAVARAESLRVCSPSPRFSIQSGDVCSLESAVKTSRGAVCVVHF